MKTKIFFTAIAVATTLFLSAQEARSTTGASGTNRLMPRPDRTRVFDEDKQYIVFKFWSDADPLSTKEKTELQNLKQQLLGKNVQVIDFQYKSAADIEKILKENGIEDVTVSTEKGIFLTSKKSNYSTTSSKAIFVFEGKSPDVPKHPVILSTGDESINHVKTFFKLRSFS